MKFYSENKVNPLASCLPLAAQLPVFISLFYMLRNDLRHEICGQTVKVSGPCGSAASHAAKFLFIPDLTDKATGAVLVVLLDPLRRHAAAVSGLTMAPASDKSQRTMMLILPLIFVPFVIRFPAGLVVYWITTNFWTILQQYIIKRRLGPIGPGAGRRPPGRPPRPRPRCGADAAAVLRRGRRRRLHGEAAPAAVTRAGPRAAGADGDRDRRHGNGRARSGGAPPPPPRRKKKRSGRRR